MTGSAKLRDVGVMTRSRALLVLGKLTGGGGSGQGMMGRNCARWLSGGEHVASAIEHASRVDSMRERASLRSRFGPYLVYLTSSALLYSVSERGGESSRCSYI